MRNVLSIGILAVLFLSGPICTPPATNPGEPQLSADELVMAVGSPSLTVIEYADFQCPFCTRFARETFPTIREQYIDTGKVRWIFRHFPLTSKHPYAWKAAEAAQCANNQSRFWEYHNVLAAHRDALQVDQLKSYADELSLDRSQFDACLDAGGEASKVEGDLDEGRQAGVSGTPTFVINGQVFPGYHDIQQMSDLLDSLLAGGQ